MRQSTHANKAARVVELALAGLNQAEIGRAVGIGRTAANRLIHRPEVAEELQALRAAAMLETWRQFGGLLQSSIEYLQSALASPLVDRNQKMRIASKMLELGLHGGPVAPQQAVTLFAALGGAQSEERGDPAPFVVTHPDNDSGRERPTDIDSGPDIGPMKRTFHNDTESHHEEEID